MTGTIYTDPDFIAAVGGQVVAVLVAVGTLVGVIVNAVLTIRNSRQVEEVKVLANGNLHQERARNQELTELLSHTNIPIPPTNNVRDTHNE